MIPPGGTAPDAAAISSVLGRPRGARRASPRTATRSPRPTTPSSSPRVPSPATTPPSAARTLAELVGALDAAGSGAVVAGDAASAAENGLVGVDPCRPGALGRRSPPSTTSATSAGQISTVLALGQRGRGHLGQVRHRGGHPAGSAGARHDAVSPATTVSGRGTRAWPSPGPSPPGPLSPGPPRSTARPGRCAVAADELRRPAGHPARRPGARRLRDGHRRARCARRAPVPPRPSSAPSRGSSGATTTWPAPGPSRRGTRAWPGTCARSAPAASRPARSRWPASAPRRPWPRC